MLAEDKNLPPLEGKGDTTADVKEEVLRTVKLHECKLSHKHHDV